MSITLQPKMLQPTMPIKIWVNTFHKMIDSNNCKKLSQFLLRFPEYRAKNIEDSLIYAIQKGVSCEILNILLQNGATLQPVDDDGRTLLIIAFTRSNNNSTDDQSSESTQKICEWVVNSISIMINDKNIDSTITEYINMYDFNGCTALMHAMNNWYSDEHLISFLLTNGANPLICDLNLQSTLNILVNCNNLYKLFNDETINNVFFSYRMINEFGSQILESFLYKVAPSYNKYYDKDNANNIHHNYVINIITRLMTPGTRLSAKTSHLLDNPRLVINYYTVESFELLTNHVMKMLHLRLPKSINNIISNYLII